MCIHYLLHGVLDGHRLLNVSNCVPGWARISRTLWTERTTWTHCKITMPFYFHVYVYSALWHTVHSAKQVVKLVLIKQQSSYCLLFQSSNFPLLVFYLSHPHSLHLLFPHCLPPFLFFLFFSSCRDLLVWLVCVETPVPRERRDTQVLSVSLDPQESRERRETGVCLDLRDPPDPKESL